jgi:hypothetical protein
MCSHCVRLDADSTGMHGPGTMALKAARRDARQGQQVGMPDLEEDVKTPLTVSSRQEHVLFTIGAPLELPSKQKPSRLLSVSPAPRTAKLGVRMLEPAPMPQGMTPATMLCATGLRTAASSPDNSGACPQTCCPCCLPHMPVVNVDYCHPKTALKHIPVLRVSTDVRD